MNREGKATTIFLLVLAILSLCLTAGTLVLFKQEKDKRISIEQQLDQITNAKLQLEKKLEEAKKQSLMADEKLKEAEANYSDLSNELEVQKSFKEQLATENKDLKDKLSQEGQERENIKARLSRAVSELKALKEKLKSLNEERVSLEQKIKNTVSGQEVSLERIVVTPTDNEGNIVVINREHDFAVINLGEINGISVGQVLSVYRDKKYLGDVKVGRIQGNLSVVDFVSPLNKDRAKEGDRVVFKK